MCGLSGGIWTCGPVAGAISFLFFFGGWGALQATWEKARDDRDWQQELERREKEQAMTQQEREHHEYLSGPAAERVREFLEK